MVNGEWAMGNGEWAMGNGEWAMVNGEWAMVNNYLLNFLQSFTIKAWLLYKLGFSILLLH
jgi:hypothetical protein